MLSPCASLSYSLHIATKTSPSEGSGAAGVKRGAFPTGEARLYGFSTVMVQEEYDSKISCLHSPFPLEGRKGLSRSPFIHTGAAGAHLHLPFTIYHLQFSLCVPRLPRLHRKRHKRRSPLSRASSLFMKLYSLFFSEIRICSSGKRSMHHPDQLRRQRLHRMHIQRGGKRSSGELRRR